MFVVILACLIFHFLADFLFQTREIAQNKSIKILVLLKHLKIIALTFFIGGFLVFIGTELIHLHTVIFAQWLMFISINTALHGLIDWNIWRVYKKTVSWRNLVVPHKEFRFWEDNWYFLTIGLDQLLHTSIIVVLVWWLL